MKEVQCCICIDKIYASPVTDTCSLIPTQVYYLHIPTIRYTCSIKSAYVHYYLHISTIIYTCPPLSTHVCCYLHISASATFTHVHSYLLMSAVIYSCPLLFTHVHCYLLMSTVIYSCPLLFTHVRCYLLMSTVYRFAACTVSRCSGFCSVPVPRFLVAGVLRCLSFNSMTRSRLLPWKPSPFCLKHVKMR